MKNLTHISAFIVVTFIVWTGIGGPVPPAAANSKIAELQQKVADIALLHQELGHRIEQANEMREVFEQQRQLLTDEMTVLKNNCNATNGIPAEDELRIHYNKELLRVIATYTSQLEAKIVFFQTGQDKLTYLQKLACDDIRLIDTLKDLAIDALMTQISLVINTYLTEAHTIQLNPVEILSPVPEETWRTVANTKFRTP
jgi:hypothetical protein